MGNLSRIIFRINQTKFLFSWMKIYYNYIIILVLMYVIKHAVYISTKTQMIIFAKLCVFFSCNQLNSSTHSGYKFRCLYKNFNKLFRRFRKIVKATINLVIRICLSVISSAIPYGKLGLPIDGFSWNLTSENFSKICRENSGFSKIWYE
jgi:hypothetical protein